MSDDFGLVYRLRFGGGALNEDAADRIEFLEEWVEAHTRKIDRYWKALKRIADHEVAGPAYAIECTLLDAVLCARDTLDDENDY